MLISPARSSDKMTSVLCFDDVLLVPRYSEGESRKDISLDIDLGPGGSLSLPIVSSPMDTVTESAMTIAMHRSGGLGIIHRYNTIEEQASLVKEVRASGMCNVGAAIGVTGDFINRARALYDAGARVICVDIAHGHHAMMRHALQVLRNTFGTDIHIMAGNVATREAFDSLSGWGADSVRVGIGGGSICSTRIQTGHGVPTLQSILDVAESKHAGQVKIIADGGIRNSGDIVKALAAGADIVMLGSLLAGSDETPGEEIFLRGGKFKEYRGMASVEAQIQWRGHVSSREGVSTTIACKGSASDVVANLELGIRSCLSYSGATSVSELQRCASFIRQTSSGAVESSTHINNDNLI